MYLSVFSFVERAPGDKSRPFLTVFSINSVIDGLPGRLKVGLSVI